VNDVARRHEERVLTSLLLVALIIAGIVLMMLFRPAGILPSALRKRELETNRAA